LRAAPNQFSYSRCGFVVGKKIGGAGVRNQVKLRLREIARLTPVVPGWDLVIIARQPAAAARYATLKKTYDELLKKAGLINHPSGTE